MFRHLVDLTEPICQAIDSAKADIIISDSSGVEVFVTENNPRCANRVTRQLKTYAKSKSYDKLYNPYRVAHGTVPSHASTNPEVKQLCVDGHFCYVFKLGIVTNGLGIIRHIFFYNRDFIVSHPGIVVEKKMDSPDEDKFVHDPKLLVLALKDLFAKHPLTNPKVFLGNIVFDSAQLYRELLSGPTSILWTQKVENLC